MMTPLAWEIVRTKMIWGTLGRVMGISRLIHSVGQGRCLCSIFSGAMGIF